MTITLRPSAHRSLKEYKTIYENGRKVGWVARDDETGRWSGALYEGKTSFGFSAEIAALIAPKVGRLLGDRTARKSKLDEAGFLKGMGDRIKNGISDFAADTKDRIAYGLGDKGRQGSIDLRLATKTLTQQWNTYARRKHSAGDPNILERPTIANLVAFLRLQYGIKVNPEELNHVLNNTKPEPEPEAPPAKPAAQQAVEARLARLVGLTLAEAGISDKQLPSDDEEEAEKKPVTADQVTFNPRTAFVKIADMLMDAGLMQVSRDGKATSGSLHGGNDKADDGEGSDPADVEVVSPEEGAEIAAKVTASGTHLNMKRVSDTLGAKRVSAAQLEWIRQNLVSPNVMKQIASGASGVDAKSGGMPTNELVSNVTLADVDALTKEEIKGTNITALGTTCDVTKMAEIMEKWGVSDEQIEALRGTIQNPEQLEQLLVAGKDSAILPVFGVVNAFVNSLVKVEK